MIQVITLKPKDTLDLKFKFEPKFRIPKFSEEFIIELEGCPQNLLFIIGTGHGIELKLETDIITFGSVVLNGSSTQKVKLKNIGDVGTKFKLETASLSQHFSVSPTEGFLSPGMDIVLKVVFRPTAVR